MKARKVGQHWQATLLPKVRAIDEQKRQITFTASTEAVDRYSDIIRVKGWNFSSYEKNPIVLWSHDTKIPPIGKCVKIWTEQNPPALVQTVEFCTADANPLGDQIFRLFQGSFLNAVSVGFRPTEAPKMITDAEGHSTGYEFISQELLELSVVAVPANTQALMRMFEIVDRQPNPNMPSDPNADEPGEGPEDEVPGSLEDLCEEIGEALDQAQAAYVTLLARIQGGATPAAPSGTSVAASVVKESSLDELLKQLVVKS